jgi:hypothetical protein
MPVLGRNLGVGPQLKQKVLLGNGTAAANGSLAGSATGRIHFALRSDVQVQEVGVTIVGGSQGTNATTDTSADVAFYYRKAGAAPVKFASAAVGAAAAVGSEFTSRDGTITFVAAYDHPSKRIFPKGTWIGAEFDSGAGLNGNSGENADFFACWFSAPEYGAPPA